MTVEEHCPHDCIYRRRVSDGYGCMYAVVECEVRGCAVGPGCIRYKKGKPKRPRLDSVTDIYWEYEEEE